MRKLKTAFIICACILALGAQAQHTNTTPIPRDKKIRIAHELTRYEGSQRMDGGMADDSGWKLRLWFFNTPAVCVKAHAHISIWREKDIFHPCNNGNENLNWEALERMWFNGDRDNAVNPKHYGYVVNDPSVNEKDLKVCILEFQWSSDKELTVFLPDYLFMNMPLPPNPDNVENLPIRYYIEYEADFENTHFSTRRGVTPSVTYTMYVPDHHAHITDLGDEDISSLFDDTPVPPHRHDMKVVSRMLREHSLFVNGNCQTEFDIYDVVSVCQNQPCDFRQTTTEMDTLKLCTPEPPEHEHECTWEYGDQEKIGEVVEKQIVNGQTCWLYYDMYRQEAHCTICGAVDHVNTWSQYTKKICQDPPIPPTPPVEPEICQHPKWIYFYDRYRINHRMLQKAIAPYDEDSLCFTTDTLDVHLTRRANKGGAYYMGIPIANGHLLCIQNEEEANAIIEHMNQLAIDSLHIQVVFTLPTEEEKRVYLNSNPSSSPDAFIIKAMPYASFLYGTERIRWNIIMRQCTKCGKIELVKIRKKQN